MGNFCFVYLYLFSAEGSEVWVDDRVDYVSFDLAYFWYCGSERSGEGLGDFRFVPVCWREEGREGGEVFHVYYNLNMIFWLWCTILEWC